MKKLEKNIDKLIEIKYKIKNSITKEEEKEITEKINLINNENKKFLFLISNAINELKSELENIKVNINNENDIQKKNNLKNILRVNQNLFIGVFDKYEKLYKRINKEENEIKNIKENKQVRSVEILLNRELDEEEKEKVKENPEVIEQLYKNILKDISHRKLQEVIKDLQERHKDIQQIEKSAKQLHGMIVESYKIVQYQGELINNIVKNVKNAKNYIIKGEKRINCYQKCFNCKEKIKKCIMISIIVVAAIILIPILISILI